MPRNKPRLLLALYARPKHPDSYHYALLIAPKIAVSKPGQPVPASKLHVKNTLQTVDGQVLQPWRFERVELSDIAEDARLLACAVIGKVCSQAEVETAIEQTPVDQIEGGGEFNCLTWVRDALERARLSSGVSGLLSWEVIQPGALEYVNTKKKQGRWDAGQNTERTPVMDLLTARELVF